MRSGKPERQGRHEPLRILSLTLQPGDELIVGNRLRQILDQARTICVSDRVEKGLWAHQKWIDIPPENQDDNTSTIPIRRSCHGCSVSSTEPSQYDIFLVLSHQRIRSADCQERLSRHDQGHVCRRRAWSSTWICSTPTLSTWPTRPRPTASTYGRTSKSTRAWTSPSIRCRRCDRAHLRHHRRGRTFLHRGYQGNAVDQAARRPSTTSSAPSRCRRKIPPSCL